MWTSRFRSVFNACRQAAAIPNKQSSFTQPFRPVSFRHPTPSTGGKRDSTYYAATIGVVFLGAGFAAVPLYRLYCQSTGYGGATAQKDYGTIAQTDQKKGKKKRQFIIQFQSDVNPKLRWSFQPAQREIRVTSGETALAFFKAKNLSNQPLVGLSSYNVLPNKAGLYFNKIQCFCFEEQMLNPKEEVDMPVFFFIDPEIEDDTTMDDVHIITLSYTFFKSNLELGKHANQANQAAAIALPAVVPVPVTLNTQTAKATL